MLSRLLNIITVLSLLLCMATVGIWVRSYWSGDAATFITSHSGSVAFIIDEGHLQVGYRTNLADDVSRYETEHWAVVHGGGEGGGGLFVDEDWIRVHWMDFASPESTTFGFGCCRNERGGNEILGGTTVPSFYGTIKYTSYSLLSPLWFLALITLTLPFTRGYLVWRRRKPKGVGCCQNCGYDLRASKDRCPECGTAITVGAKA